MGSDNKSSRRDSDASKLHQGDERPFDLWLRKQLHAMYDGVAKEPLPDDLLKLIEDDRQRATSSEPASSDRSDAESKRQKD